MEKQEFHLVNTQYKYKNTIGLRVRTQNTVGMGLNINSNI